MLSRCTSPSSHALMISISSGNARGSKSAQSLSIESIATGSSACTKLAMHTASRNSGRLIAFLLKDHHRVHPEIVDGHLHTVRRLAQRQSHSSRLQGRLRDAGKAAGHADAAQRDDLL